MRILALGDVVGHVAIDYLADKLWAFRSKEKIDFCVANGENATEIRGISAADAEALLDTGVDLITLGNHAFGMKDVYNRTAGSALGRMTTLPICPVGRRFPSLSVISTLKASSRRCTPRLSPQEKPQISASTPGS